MIHAAHGDSIKEKKKGQGGKKRKGKVRLVKGERLHFGQVSETDRRFT